MEPFIMPERSDIGRCSKPNEPIEKAKPSVCMQKEEATTAISKLRVCFFTFVI